MTLLTGEKAEKIRAFKSGPVRSNSLHLSNRFFFRLGTGLLLEIIKSTVDRQGLFIYVQTVHDFFLPRWAPRISNWLVRVLLKILTLVHIYMNQLI